MGNAKEWGHVGATLTSSGCKENLNCCRKTSRDFQLRSGVQDRVGWDFGQPDLVPESVVGIPACSGVQNWELDVL